MVRQTPVGETGYLTAHNLPALPVTKQRSEPPMFGETGTNLLPDLMAMLPGGVRVPVGVQAAEGILRDHYGIDGRAITMTGERDENFCVIMDGVATYVLKVPGGGQPQAETDMFVSVLRHLEREDPRLPVPRLVPNRWGDDITCFTDASGEQRRALLCSFLSGTPLIDAPRVAAQREQSGRLLAKTAVALKNFSHPAMNRTLVWDLRQIPALAAFLPRLDDLPDQKFIARFIDGFASMIKLRLDLAPRQFVHNDFNARNIIVDQQDTSRVVGVIDFGDALHTARVADVAIGVIGQLSNADTAELAMHEFIAAYQSVTPLDAAECALLNWLVAGRIVQNVIMTTWYRTHGPNQEHFAAFGKDFFAWRLEFARQLVTDSPFGRG